LLKPAKVNIEKGQVSWVPKFSRGYQSPSPTTSSFLTFATTVPKAPRHGRLHRSRSESTSNINHFASGQLWYNQSTKTSAGPNFQPFRITNSSNYAGISASGKAISPQNGAELQETFPLTFSQAD
jgi:hypothetical protein